MYDFVPFCFSFSEINFNYGFVFPVRSQVQNRLALVPSSLDFLLPILYSRISCRHTRKASFCVPDEYPDA